MATVIDIEIIANYLFKSIFKCINFSEENITGLINNNNNLLIDNFKHIKEFETNFIYSLINDVKKRMDKLDIGDDIITRRINNAIEEIENGQQDLNEDLINLITNKFNDLSSFLNNKFIQIEDNFKYIINNILNTNHLPKSSTRKNKKGRNSELTINKKYCDHNRSQGRGKCTILINKKEEACYVHKKYVITNQIEAEADKIKVCKKNIKFKNIINKVILINKFKKMLKTRKSESNLEADVDELKIKNKQNLFNYDYLLKNKKGFLFKEDNKLYTYNLYEEKIIANKIDGVFCDYCGYTRYNSSPCIFRNCKNRKFDDFEFKMYKKINGKEMESKYNKKYINTVNNKEIDSSSEFES